MWQGKSAETGETLIGYYGEDDFEYIKPVHAHDCASWGVDPATIEPVRVKPIERGKTYTGEKCGTCPNCRYRELLEHQLFCDQCGQALDWQDTP